MRHEGEYELWLCEGVSALVSYYYETDESGDDITPNGGAIMEIHKIVLTNGVHDIDITSAVDTLCETTIDKIEDQIIESLSK
jgi:hypothetical protein